MDLTFAQNSEYGRLKSVLLHIPTKTDFILDAEEAMFTELPNFVALHDEVEEYIYNLNNLGIAVYSDRDFPDRHHNRKPNQIFMRDLGAVVGNVLILAKPRFPVRQGEEKYLQSLLQWLNPPSSAPVIVATLDSECFFEGADLLVLGDTVVINVGFRTNERAAVQIGSLLKDKYKIKIVQHNRALTIPQHILGATHVIGPDTLIQRVELHSDDLGFKNVVELYETKEVVNRYSMNVVTIAENEIIMPGDCPTTRLEFENAGIKCHTSPMNEIRKMSGGFACMTLPLERENV